MRGKVADKGVESHELSTAAVAAGDGDGLDSVMLFWWFGRS
jgi:hypothetical protein